MQQSQARRRRFLRGSAIAVAIKGGGAALAYGLVLVVAKVTDEVNFGYFGTSWAAFTLLAAVGLLGQHSVVMRYWPQWNSAGDQAAANGYLYRSLLLSGGGLGLVSAMVVAGALLPSAVPGWTQICLATAVLTFSFGWSEVISAGDRARGSVLRALAPRDVVWRLLTIALLALLWAGGATSDAAGVLWLAGGVLTAIAALHTLDLLGRSGSERRRSLTRSEQAAHWKTTTGLWGVNAFPVLLGQVNTVAVALVLGPFWAGLYFASERSSQLLSVAMNGINQALAPEVASAFHSGDLRGVQHLCDYVALASTVVAAFVLCVFFAGGYVLLGVFNPQYAIPEGVAVLLVLALGQGATALCGATNVVLQMTGHQVPFLKILVISGVIGTMLMVILALAIGVLGAAIGSACTAIAWNGLAVLYARKHIGVDPSILGRFFPPLSPVGTPT